MKIEGWIDKKNLADVLHYSKAIGYEISDNQKPIDILRIRRVYSKPLKNYWFKSRNKVKNWIKIRIEVKEIL